MSARPMIIDDPDLHAWGDLFVAAGLHPFLRFDEFMRDPAGIVAALSDPAVRPPACMPCLRERIAAHLRWGVHCAPRRVLIAGETR